MADDRNPLTSGLFTGGGRMGERMAAYDWASSPLGPPDGWPASLRAVIRLMLTSRYAMWMGWGPELTFFYNDAYAPTLGVKQDWALGSPASKVWQEIWPDIGPRIETVLTTAEATYDEGLLLFLERSGFPEETYHTFSYSPLFDDSGAVAGMFCVVVEETERLIGERRLRTLRELAAATTDARTVKDACRMAAEGLAANRKDVPYALIYLLDANRRRLELAAASGLTPPHPSAPVSVDLADPEFGELDQAIRTGEPVLRTIAPRRRDLLPPHADGWDVAPERSAIVPLGSGESGPTGVMAVALNPYRAFDENYAGFLDLLAGQVSAAMASAHSYEEERGRAEALAEIDRAKTAFFSNVSHEFRTPLTLLLGPLEEALSRALNSGDPGETELLQTAHRNGLRLLKLVNTLLDFSRIEAGRTRALFQPTDLAAFTAELASSFRSVMERAGLELRVEAEPLSRPVLLDRDMWEKVILNLLSNAFKFTLEGGVTVRIGEDADGPFVRVADTGTGIAERELPRLFERFHRVEGAKGRSYEGSGIGLALVQELVKLHGGRIEVESKLGTGSAFTVRLPFEAAGGEVAPAGEDDLEPPSSKRAQAFVEEALRWLPEGSDEAWAGPAADAGEAQASADGAGRLVLLADDNSDMRDYVRRLLSGHGYAVEAVGDGEAALQAARRRLPDLILSDVMMPKLDGFGVLRGVREDASLRDTPVVLLSARAGEEARVQGLDAGADDYLIKPFAARELLARVGAMIALSTLRRATAQTLRDSEERLRQAVRATGIGIWDVDPTNGRRTWSEEFYRIMGVDPGQEADNDYFAALIHPDDRPAVERSYADAYSAPEKGRYTAEFRIRRANDGAERWVRTEGRISYGEDGRPIRGTGTLLDITERRQIEAELEARVAERTAELAAANRQLTAQIAERERVEEALRRSQRLEAVGQLTSGVAHDFNNLLTVILGNIGFLMRNADAESGRRLEMMRSAAMRGASLTGQLLAFSRRQRLDAKRIDLNDAIDNMRELLQSTLGGGIRISAELQPELWPALVDPTQFELVVLNLAINARDAMGVGGSLIVKTANVTLGEAVLPEDPPLGDYVMTSITDTGSGMTGEVLAKAFEPFFTTKEPGKGSGLGLAQVFGFARQSGGGVKITTELGVGTTVAVFLPRAKRFDDAPAVLAQEAQARPRDGVTVLVVDDDSAVRDVTAAVLREHGYAVEEAGSGAGALEILGNAARIDAMVADYAMPGMNGVELAQHARRGRPDLPIVFLTGYVDTEVLSKAGERFVVQKPFQVDDLVRRVQSALDEAESARA